MKDLPTYESNRFKREGWGKTRYSTPLPYSSIVRFLHSRCGQHLDKVFSEFSKADWIPAVRRTYNEFKSHVKVDTFMQDGEVYFRDYFQEPKKVKDHNSKNFFYIHPVSKVLIHKPHTGVPSYKERKKEKQKEFFRFLAAGHQLIKYKGIWYEYTFTVDEFEQGSFNKETGKFDQKRRSQKDIDRDSTEPVYCPHEKKLVTWWNYWPRIKNVKRRQLSGKELKSFGLTND
jgi:hypothetical protein